MKTSFQKANRIHRVFVVTTSFGDLGNTYRLLGSLSRQSHPLIRIFVVEHGKTGKEYKSLTDAYKNITVIRGNEGMWWTSAINLAIKKALRRAAPGDFIFTINNDCTFNRYLISEMVNISNNSDRSVVGSFEVDAEDKRTVVSGVIKANWQAGIFESLVARKAMEADTLSTKGTLIPVEVFEKIGLLDDKHFPHYGSDYEFFIRARKNGFRLLASPKMKIYCDIERTGIFDKGGSLGLKKITKLAFSRKSQINLIDHINLIRFCCPPRYKIRNYLLLIGKIAYLVSRIYPISLFRYYFYGDKSSK